MALALFSGALAQSEPPPADQTDRETFEDVIEHHGVRGAPGEADVDEGRFGVMLMRYARLLFEAGSKDEAVFWHYAGQLRYRLYAAQAPKRGGEFFGDFPRLWEEFEDLMARGEAINVYAYCDVSKYAATIDEVLSWHETTPYVGAAPTDDTVTPAEFAEAEAQVVAGLRGLREYALENADTIKTERAANGIDDSVVCK